MAPTIIMMQPMDDAEGSDDEDGVTSFPTLTSAATSYSVDIAVTNNTGTPATVFAWIDFDLDGAFQVDEGTTQTVTDGTTNGSVTVTWSNIGTSGPDILPGVAYARFRLTTDGTISTSTSGGSAVDGEVEDYRLLISVLPTSCNGGDIAVLNFASPSLESGTALQVGAQYRFPDVIAGIDALIDVVSFNNGASLSTIDNAGQGVPSAFQPTLVTSTQADSSVDFTITFVAGGTSAPITIQESHISGVDIDGDGTDLREYIELTGFSSYIIDNPTRLTPTITPPTGRFESTNVDNATDIDPNEPRNIVSGVFENVSSFNYRIGAFNTGNDVNNRLNSLFFDCVAYDDPSTIDVTAAVDYGDAPDTYDTLDASNGPFHVLDSDILMGSSIDSDNDGFGDGTDNNGNASDDDTHSSDDEDGVSSLNSLNVATASYDVDVTITNNTTDQATLIGWIDFDLNGTFDSNEAATTTVAANGTENGTKTLTWNSIPTDIAAGTSYLRLRLTTDTNIDANSPGGSADDGEVEDYELLINAIVELSAATAASTDESAADNFPVLLVLGNIINGPLTVDLDDLLTGSALNSGTDYTISNSTAISIPIGNYDGTLGTAIAITVPVLNNDTDVEGDETIDFQLTNAGNGAVVGDANGDTSTQDTHTYTITDDDIPAITVEDVSIAEGGGLLFTVTLDGPVTGGFTVDVSFSDISATGGTDYDNSAAMLTFAGTANEMQTFTVTTTTDTGIEGDETFTVNLSASTVNVDDSDTGIGTIIDVQSDFGDAPDRYATDITDSSGEGVGASHTIVSGIQLGANPPDADSDGFGDGTDDNGDASDDDSEGSDDEDGVSTLSAINVGASSYSIDVDVTNDTSSQATLVGWIDFDRNGTFGTDEATTITVAANGVDNGTVTLDWNTIPTDIRAGTSYVRLRLTTDTDIGGTTFGADTPGGAADDGEVEDYRLSIVALPILCDGDSVFELFFVNPTLESGTALSVNAVYRFSEVTTDVDALVEITAFNNGAFLSNIDNTSTGLNSAFQPIIRSGTTADSSVDFTISFVDTGTSTPTTIQKFHATALDIDGNPGNTSREYEEITGFTSFIVENPTDLTVVVTPPTGHFEAATTTDFPGINTSVTEIMATGVYGNVSSFDYRIGVLLSDTSSRVTRFRSLFFDCVTYNNSARIELFDYGDAPDSYGTDATDDSGEGVGPSHMIDSGIFMGSAATDVDSDGFGDGTDDFGDASDDDVEGSLLDDEDGVTTLPALTTATATYDLDVEVINDTASQATLVGWIDFDLNGTFDSNEATSTTVAASGAENGTKTLTWNSIPVDIAAGTSLCSSTPFYRYRYRRHNLRC